MYNYILTKNRFMYAGYWTTDRESGYLDNNKQVYAN